MSDAPVVMRAQYSDLKLIKTRKVAQLVFEIPLEQLQSWVALFGIPDPHQEAWCAIARLRTETKPTASERGHKAYANSTPGEQAVTRAVLLTKDPQFQAWLSMRMDEAGISQVPASDEGHSMEGAATSLLKSLLGIASRADLALGGKPLADFHQLEYDYKTATGRVAEPH